MMRFPFRKPKNHPSPFKQREFDSRPANLPYISDPAGQVNDRITKDAAPTANGQHASRIPAPSAPTTTVSRHSIGIRKASVPTKFAALANSKSHNHSTSSYATPAAGVPGNQAPVPEATPGSESVPEEFEDTITPPPSRYVYAQLASPCSAGALSHVLASCGHKIITGDIRPCASNCSPSTNPRDLDQEFACETCIDASVINGNTLEFMKACARISRDCPTAGPEQDRLLEEAADHIAYFDRTMKAAGYVGNIGCDVISGEPGHVLKWMRVASSTLDAGAQSPSQGDRVYGQSVPSKTTKIPQRSQS